MLNQGLCVDVFGFQLVTMSGDTVGTLNIETNFSCRQGFSCRVGFYEK